MEKRVVCLKSACRSARIWASSGKYVRTGKKIGNDVVASVSQMFFSSGSKSDICRSVSGVG
ncbi:hypothetical protein PSPTOT1_0488 [Pseudomonas syringae pv. tomato T1]|nr:hypothetical protein PSPTOT1_0488 [Pseudomonas syringae pv. tomato T1]